MNKISKWWKKYRVVHDRYCGYEVQCWRIWFPFWLQCGFTNTHFSLEKAENYARIHANGGVIKHL